MRIYIVARPYDEIEEFIPMYITNHKKKAQTFWHLYNDESIMMIIFSKEWDPDQPDKFPNIVFNYLGGDLTDKYYHDGMCSKNTLHGKYQEWLDLDEEISSLYMSGDPDEEYTDSGMMNPKIWNLD